MNGGLLKSTSTLAITAAAGILVGGVTMGTAKAADLGGDCCADLEERVAELEATTVRKGNRKVSLTLQGFINTEVMNYSDKSSSHTFAGVTNGINASRFWLSGEAKVSSSVKAGFEFMIEMAGGARSDVGVTQKSFDGVTRLGSANITGTSTGSISTTANAGAFNSPQLGVNGQAFVSGTTDGYLAIRTANWWMEEKTLGRVTVGRVNINGPVANIDISGGNVTNASWSNLQLQGGGMFLVGKNGAFTTTPYSGPSGAGIIPFCYGCSREEGIRYDSVSIGGLLLQAFWGSQDRWSASARYAAEFGGFQFAAGYGWQQDDKLGAVTPDVLASSAIGRNSSSLQSGSIALKHVATGLFAQGTMGQTKYDAVGPAFAQGANSAFPAGTIPAVGGGSNLYNSGKNAGVEWQIQGGIAKNFFGPGVTAIFGEYGKARGYLDGQATTTPTFLGGSQGFVALVNISGSEVTHYGAGVVQNIDSAAMSLYLNWRHYDTTLNAGTITASGTAAATVYTYTPGLGALGGGISSYDMIIAGARINF